MTAPSFFEQHHVRRADDLDATLRLRRVTVAVCAELRHLVSATASAERAFNAVLDVWPEAYAVEGDECDRLIARVFTNGRCIATIAEGVGAEVLP